MIKRLHKRRGHQGSAKTCMYEWYTLYLCSVYVQCILPLGLWGRITFHIPHCTLHITIWVWSYARELPVMVVRPFFGMQREPQAGDGGGQVGSVVQGTWGVFFLLCSSSPYCTYIHNVTYHSGPEIIKRVSKVTYIQTRSYIPTSSPRYCFSSGSHICT